jgi:hypothetical protein
MERLKKILEPLRGVCLSLPVIFLLSVMALAEYKIILKNGQTILAQSRPVSMEGAYRFQGITGQMQTVPVEQVDRRATETANRNARPSAAPRKMITNEDLKSGGDSADENPAEPDHSKTPPVAGNAGKIRVGTPEKSTAAGKGYDEGYWRAKVQKIRNEQSAIAARIKEINDNVAQKKSDPMKVQMGTYSPYMIVGDYREELRQLDLHKQKLERDFAELEEEARKAGVPAGVLR